MCVLSQQGSKDVGKLPVHAYYLLLLSQPKIGLTKTDKLNCAGVGIAKP